MRTIKSIFLVVAPFFVACNAQGACYSDITKISDILIRAKELMNECSIPKNELSIPDFIKRMKISRHFDAAHKFFKLEESTTTEMSPEYKTQSQSLFKLWQKAIHDCRAGGPARDPDDSIFEDIADHGMLAGVDVFAETVAREYRSKVMKHVPNTLLCFYVPNTLLSFESPLTNVRMGFLGTVIGLVGERCTRHVQFFSTVKKLSALQAAMTTVYAATATVHHAYRCKNYVLPRRAILDTYVKESYLNERLEAYKK